MIPRVLIVDDNVDLAENLAEIVTDEGFEAEIYSRPSAALAAFEPGRFALALLDIRMPEMDGIELFRRLRERDAALPAIAMTGYTHDERLHDAVASGLLATIAKPVKIPDLLRRVATATKGSIVIVVDDAADLAQSVADVLAEHGFSARPLHSCAEARRVVEALPVAVAIVDWRLPDGDGLALIAELRARHPSLRGILVTGFARDEAELSTRAASTDAGFFEKPVPLERLLGAIEAARPPS